MRHVCKYQNGARPRVRKRELAGGGEAFVERERAGSRGLRGQSVEIERWGALLAFRALRSWGGG